MEEALDLSFDRLLMMMMTGQYMHLTESYNFLSIYTIYIHVLEKCRKQIHKDKRARQKENNKARYETKIFLQHAEYKKRVHK